MADGYINEKRRQGKPFVLDEIMHDFKEWSDMFRRLSYRGGVFMNAIDISHITKDYGSHKGIFDVSLSVKKVRFTAFSVLTAREKPPQYGICLVFCVRKGFLPHSGHGLFS